MRIATPGKGDIAAASIMLDEIESIERNSVRPEASKIFGKLKFEPHGHRQVSFGFADGKCVAAIRKIAQHRHSGNRVYQVKVLDQILPDHCRTIEDARSLAAQAYETQTV